MSDKSLLGVNLPSRKQFLSLTGLSSEQLQACWLLLSCVRFVWVDAGRFRVQSCVDLANAITPQRRCHERRWAD